MDQYDSLAPLYDYLIPDPPGMILFYMDIVRRYGGPILEIGAGTGRLSLQLAAVGHRVVAVDCSQPMLSALQAKAALLSKETQDRLQMVCADQREIRLGTRFPTVLVTGGTLQHCLAAEDYELALASARAHIEPHGILALDIARMSAQQARRSYQKDYGTYSGAHLAERWTRIRSWDEVTYDAVGGVTRTCSFFEMKNAEGEPTDRLCFEFLQTFPEPEELRAMVEHAGFVVTGLFGGFSGESPEAETEQLVLVARLPHIS